MKKDTWKMVIQMALNNTFQTDMTCAQFNWSLCALDIFIVFARNNLMNIMCKVGDSILKVNNIAKTSTQTNTKKRSTQKTDDSTTNDRKKIEDYRK